MDTKSKSSSTKGRVVCILLVAVLAATILGFAFASYDSLDANRVPYFEQTTFVEQLYKNCTVLYWKLAQQNEHNLRLTPVDVFFPQASETMMALQLEEETGVLTPENEYRQELIRHFDDVSHSIMSDWYNQMANTWSEFDYLALDTKTKEQVGSRKQDILSLAQGKTDSALQQRLQEHYRYYAVISFGAGGEATVTTAYGAAKDSFSALREQDIETELFSYLGDAELENMLRDTFDPPRDAVFVFAIPNASLTGGAFYYDELHFDMYYLERGGIAYVYFGALLLAGLLGLLMARSKRFALEGTRFTQLSLESSIILILLALFSYNSMMVEYLTKLVRGSLFVDLATVGYEADLRTFLGGLLFFLVLFVIVGAMFCAGASLWQIRTLGLRNYMNRGSLLRVWQWVKVKAKDFWAWLTNVDLTDKGNKALIKLLVVNFIILAVLCSTWVFGLPLLVVYTIVLYVVLRKYVEKLKAQYATLVNATEQMAQGRLNVQIDGDLGVFNPLRDQLERVQHGFARAVEAETKSQNMKTELITNVSHDLKTPLTAIITYVDLLKKEDLSEEDRLKYVETLELKSQRLKRLIEDLFEMSKASSRDIHLNVTQVDLPALIRQVEAEAVDELDAAGIAFRYHFPQEKVELPLDGDKTSRIFENLVLNVAKYAMPGTRAYVDVTQSEHQVDIVMKNVSQVELDFNEEEVTERFVRGDRSRSTEGSGLGLAIAKSFTEAQGGRFRITTDGDVFKAIIVFYK